MDRKQLGKPSGQSQKWLDNTIIHLIIQYKVSLLKDYSDVKGTSLDLNGHLPDSELEDLCQSVM